MVVNVVGCGIVVDVVNDDCGGRSDECGSCGGDECECGTGGGKCGSGSGSGVVWWWRNRKQVVVVDVCGVVDVWTGNDFSSLTFPS